MPTSSYKALASFNPSTNGSPYSLTIDAAGDIFGLSDNGSVFELGSGPAGYPQAATVLVTRSGITSQNGRLVVDSAGNLFLLATGQGQNDQLWELRKTGNSYASSLTLIASFTGLGNSLLIDNAGNLFANIVAGFGSSVVEIARTSSGYGSPVTLASVPATTAGIPSALTASSLAIDAAGNLVGVARAQSANSINGSLLFEVPRTAAGYGGLVFLDRSTDTAIGAADPSIASIILDAAGDIFAATSDSIYELQKSATGYASSVVRIGSFSGGSQVGTLLLDRAGNLFGETMISGGSQLQGQIYELPKTSTGYGPRTVRYTFDATAGKPLSGLIVDTAGNVFGSTGGVTTLPGASPSNGSVFEIANAGYQITPATIGVYRFFDTKLGTHFYTADASEAATIRSSRPDLVPEGTNGIGLQAIGSLSSDPNATAVYRFFDNIHGTHFFTASASERDNVLATRQDLVYEPSATFYEHAVSQTGDVPVYRFFDTVYGTHFYTDSAAELAGIKATRPDLTYEGVGFYEPPQNYLS